jgi:hypothetical protein
MLDRTALDLILSDLLKTGVARVTVSRTSQGLRRPACLPLSLPAPLSSFVLALAVRSAPFVGPPQGLTFHLPEGTLGPLALSLQPRPYLRPDVVVLAPHCAWRTVTF